MKNCVKNAMKFLRVTTVPPKCYLHKVTTDKNSIFL